MNIHEAGLIRFWYLSPIYSLTLYLLVSSADTFCKQFGPRSGPTRCWVYSVSKLFDILIVFLKEFFKKKNYFEKNQQTTKNMKKSLGGQIVK